MFDMVANKMHHEQEQLQNGQVAFEAYDYPSALALLLPLAENENAQAQSLVGYVYSYSLHRLPKSEDEVRWSSLSKKELDIWETQDTPEAIKWLTKASEQGIGPASHNLAMLIWSRSDALSQGDAQAEARAEARSLLERAWAQGCRVSAFPADDLQDVPSPERL